MCGACLEQIMSTYEMTGYVAEGSFSEICFSVQHQVHSYVFSRSTTLGKIISHSGLRSSSEKPPPSSTTC